MGRKKRHKRARKVKWNASSIPAPRAIGAARGHELPGGFDGSKFPNALRMESIDPEHLDHTALRYHSTRCYLTNSLAHGLIDTKTTSVINRGLCLEAKPAVDIIGKDNVSDDWSRLAEQAFDLWASHKGADYNFKQNFYQIESEGFRHSLEKGRAFAVVRCTPDPRRGRIGRCNVQLLHSDLLCSPFEESARLEKSGHRVSDGLHIDASGTIVGCYVRSEKVNQKRDWVYIPRWAPNGRATLVLSIRSRSPGDVHGVPDLTPVLHDLEKLEKYKVSELQAAVVNAAIALIQNSDGDKPNLPMVQGRVGKRPSPNAPQESETGALHEKISPGVHLFAAHPGQKLESYDTRRPNVNFGGFVDSFIAQIASAVGEPKEIVLKLFGNNYSASRAALLEFWRYVVLERANWAWDFCQPIYEQWLADEIALGCILAPGWTNANLMQQSRIRAAWSRAEWQGVSKGSVDPVREVTAAEIAEDRGWTTAEANSRELYGKNWDSNIERRKRESKEQQSVGEQQSSERDARE